MASFGLRDFVIAKTSSTSGIFPYETGFVVGQLCGLSVSPDYTSTDCFAGWGIPTRNVKNFAGANIECELANVDISTLAEFGIVNHWTHQSRYLNSLSNDNTVGCGFIVQKTNRNRRSWGVSWIHNVNFSLSGTEEKTTSTGITLQTVKLSGRILGIPQLSYWREDYEAETYDEARARLALISSATIPERPKSQPLPPPVPPRAADPVLDHRLHAAAG